MPSGGSGPEVPVRNEDWVAVARLTRTWGNRGELRGVPLSSHPERFKDLSEVWVRPAQDRTAVPRKLRLEQVRRQALALLFKFQGIDSIREAEALCGSEVLIPLAERLPPPDGEVYLSDLVGCQVVDRATGRPLGRVSAWMEIRGGILLEVETGTPGGEFLLPLAASICREIDTSAGRIGVELPEGLTELNR